MKFDQFIKNPCDRFILPDDCRPCSPKSARVDELLGRYTEIELDAVADRMLDDVLLDEIAQRQIEEGGRS